MLSINGKYVEINNKEEMQEEKTAIKMHDGSRYNFFMTGFYAFADVMAKRAKNTY